MIKFHKKEISLKKRGGAKGIEKSGYREKPPLERVMFRLHRDNIKSERERKHSDRNVGIKPEETRA